MFNNIINIINNFFINIINKFEKKITTIVKQNIDFIWRVKLKIIIIIIINKFEKKYYYYSKTTINLIWEIKLLLLLLITWVWHFSQVQALKSDVATRPKSYGFNGLPS